VLLSSEILHLWQEALMSGSRLAFGSVTPSKSKIKDGAQPLGDASQKVSAKALLLVCYNSTPRYNCTPDTIAR